MPRAGMVSPNLLLPLGTTFRRAPSRRRATRPTKQRGEREAGPPRRDGAYSQHSCRACKLPLLADLTWMRLCTLHVGLETGRHSR
jgi:hypothetical protein